MFFVSTIYCQENNIYHLKIKSRDSVENTFLKGVKHEEFFKNFKNLIKAKEEVLQALREKGFYTLLIEEETVKQNNYTYQIKLGNRLKETRIKINTKDSKLLKTLGLKVKNSILVLNNDQLKLTLKSIHEYLLNNGQLFSKVTLINNEVKNAILYTELQIQNSKKRTINSTVIKGHVNFPKSFVKHYLNLNQKTTLNEKKIKEISTKLNRLSFVSETKKPEILFSKDSTLLYIYLNKKQSSSFDGLINFSTEDNKLNLRGYLDLKLVDLFNKGEELKINWRNNSNNRQDFTLNGKLPYLFNSKISIETSLNLFRNDSTFTNTSLKTTLKYPVRENTNLAVLYEYENSTNNTNQNNILSYNKKMIGFGFDYNAFNKNSFQIGFDILYGTRKADTKSNQYQFSLETEGIIKTSSLTEVYLKSKSSFLFSESYLENELFREGGTNSIRGFIEQSIFTAKYSYLNSELRLNLNNRSKLYSIHDFGIFNYNEKNSILYAFGVGYQLQKNNSIINLSYAYGGDIAHKNRQNSKIIAINLLTIF